jgi:hypothetical protein
VVFDPELGNEYEYSNDLSSEDSDDDYEDKTCFDILKSCWKSIKNILKNI